MSGCILVVDDLPQNIRLLEAVLEPGDTRSSPRAPGPMRSSTPAASTRTRPSTSAASCAFSTRRSWAKEVRNEPERFNRHTGRAATLDWFAER